MLEAAVFFDLLPMLNVIEVQGSRRRRLERRRMMSEMKTKMKGGVQVSRDKAESQWMGGGR